MPPNADQLRLRRFANDNDDHDNKPEVTYKSLKSLKETEVAIEGVIYDLNGFQHPGGDSMLLFGGNDVTVQYKMMHPYHTSKHLDKMKRVGRVTDWKQEFVFDTEFEREIKREVFKIVRRGREFGTVGFFARACFYITAMAVLQYLWVTKGACSWLLAAALGVSQAMIGLNVQHDANHGAASRNHWINDLLGFGADFIGGCKWTWMQQHVTHHAFTNHATKDPDSFSAEPFMLFNTYPPNHPARKFYHALQGLYFLPLLSFYWLSSVFNVQTIDLRQRGALDVGIVMNNAFTKSRRKYAILLRLVYIYLNIIAPIRVSGLSLDSVLKVLFMGASSSLTLAVLFALSHNFQGADRDPTSVYDNNDAPVCWFKAQVETSSTYGGYIAGAFTGGLNCQIEHHLFPRMSSAWYPYIAPTVRRICQKHNVQYTYYPFMFQNLISTIKYMHSAGIGSDLMKPLQGNN